MIEVPQVIKPNLKVSLMLSFNSFEPIVDYLNRKVMNYPLINHHNE